MLIYLFGPDAYRRSQKLKQILAEHGKKHPDVPVAHFDLSESGERGQTQTERGLTQTTELEKLKEFLTAQSLFATRKLAVIHDVGEEHKETAKLLKEFLNDTETTIIVSVSDKLPKEYKFLDEKPVISQEFAELKNAELLAFLKEELARRKLTIPANVAQTLINVYSGDTWGLVTELDKLEIGGTVEDHFVIPAFFPLIQNLKSGSLPRRIAALTLLLESEESAAIFNVLASIADLPLKRKMADYDIAIKSGKLEYEEVLFDLVIG